MSLIDELLLINNTLLEKVEIPTEFRDGIRDKKRQLETDIFILETNIFILEIDFVRL
jgi:hypothetical protein